MSSKNTISYWKYVSNNKSNIKKSSNCSCIYCKETYKASDIDEFTSDNCAICPHCWVDAVVPHDMIVPTTEQLDAWHIEGFSCAPK